MIGPLFTPEEKVKRCIQRHPDWTDYRVSQTAGVHKDLVISVRSGLSPTPQNEVSAGPNGAGGLIPIQALVAKYDTRSAILRELRELPDDKVISEADLCLRVSGTDRYRFKRTIENCSKEFELHRIRIKLDKDREPVWVWGKAPAIEALKKAVNPWL